MQREKLEEEYAELMKLIEHLKAILASDQLVYDIIKEELLEMKKKFGDERKTKIVAAEGEIELEDLIKEEQVVIALTRFGYIKRAPIDTFKSQRRGGKGLCNPDKRFNCISNMACACISVSLNLSINLSFASSYDDLIICITSSMLSFQT